MTPEEIDIEALTGLIDKLRDAEKMDRFVGPFDREHLLDQAMTFVDVETHARLVSGPDFLIHAEAEAMVLEVDGNFKHKWMRKRNADVEASIRDNRHLLRRYLGQELTDEEIDCEALDRRSEFLRRKDLENEYDDRQVLQLALAIWLNKVAKEAAARNR